MTNIYKISFISLAVALFCLGFTSVAFGQIFTPQVQTNPTVGINGATAVINGTLTDVSSYGGVRVFFQWGTDANIYMHQTEYVAQNNIGSFSQTIAGLNQNTEYHFRAAAQNNYGIVYGQDMTFYTRQTGVVIPNAFVKTGYATFVSNSRATMNGSLYNNDNGALNTVFFQWGKTIAYGNDTMIQNLNYNGTFFQAIGNLDSATIYHYRAVSRGTYGIVYGQDMTFITTGYGPSPIIINYGQVLGATTISTGLTNNFLTDSFLLPLLLIISGLYLYFSGKIYVFADWVKTRI